MISNVMAVIQFLNLCADVYYWIDDKIDDLEFKRRCDQRKQARKEFIKNEKAEMRAEILRDLERNSRS
jgi:RNA polymerase-interacting CarD/CdnL/TRCF family regulator